MKFKKQDGMVVYSMKAGNDIVTGLMDEGSFEKILKSAVSSGKSTERKDMNYKVETENNTFYFITEKEK